MIVMHQGLPFDVKIPTKETEIALNELKTRDGKSFKNVDALFDDLDS
jgi:DNA-damage-inducible protein J